MFSGSLLDVLISRGKRKALWDRVEIVCIAGVAAAGLAAAFSSPAFKVVPAVFTGFFALSSAFAKWRSKCADELEKQEKQEQESAMQARYAGQARRMIQKILEVFRKRYFEAEDADQIHMHRVTLFECVEFEGPAGKGKRLEIFARAGVHQNSDRSWPLDDNDPGKCRGIAAKIWFHDNGARRVAACDWPEGDDPAARAAYAESLGITVAEAETLHVKSLAFVGVPITVSGRRWGVLLLDSRKEWQHETRHRKGLLVRYATVIAAALEGLES